MKDLLSVLTINHLCRRGAESKQCQQQQHFRPAEKRGNHRWGSINKCFVSFVHCLVPSIYILQSRQWCFWTDWAFSQPLPDKPETRIRTGVEKNSSGESRRLGRNFRTWAFHRPTNQSISAPSSSSYSAVIYFSFFFDHSVTVNDGTIVESQTDIKKKDDYKTRPNMTLE